MNKQDAKTARKLARAQCREGLISEREMERALNQIEREHEKFKSRWYDRAFA